MSLHAEPQTNAEKLARHLETQYGIQLDTHRHRGLVEEIEQFFLIERQQGREFAIEQFGESGGPSATAIAESIDTADE